jgi:uracil permease
VKLEITTSKRILLALQHVLAMFGATVLVPFLTGLDPSVALLSAGLGTLIFHLTTKGKAPVFLGSSFAFIAVIQAVAKTEGLAYASGGIVAAGVVYMLMAGLVLLFGVEKIRSFFPPIVSGPIIMVIGLTLTPVAIGMAKEHWGVAVITLAAVLITSVFARGFLKLLPLLVGVGAGMAAAFGFHLVDLTKIQEAAWFAFPHLTMPKFSLSAIMTVAPVALVVVVEHIGDITTNGAVIGKDLMKDPGLHRTLLGDGLATALAGFIGGPAATTYAENTGVLAVTKVYDPSIIRLAAIFTVAMSMIGKLGGFLNAIPKPVMGGISMLLFGMIAAIGLRTLVENRVDLGNSRNLAIGAIILALGLGGAEIPLGPNLTLHGMALAALVGVVLNKLLPENHQPSAEAVAETKMAD